MRIPKSKALYLSAAVFGLFGGSAVTADAAFKTVTVQTNGHQRVIRGFTFGSLKSFLDENGASVPEDAKVNVDLSKPVMNDVTVDVTLPKQIVLDDGDHMTQIETFANTVNDLFKEEGITIHPLDTVNVPLQSTLENNERIQINRVVRKVTTQRKTVSFRVIHRQSSALMRGQTRVITQGEKGIQEIETIQYYMNGRKLSRQVTTSMVKHPVNQIVEIGTRAPAPLSSPSSSFQLSSRGDSLAAAAGQSIEVIATAYVAGGITSTGLAARPGVIAVDPSVIPLGSRVYIPGLGTMVAEDTGGAIQGDRIDVCVASEAQALAFGRRAVRVYIES